MIRCNSIGAAICIAGILAAATGRAETTKVDGDILLQADEVVYDVDNKIVTARGHVEVDYGGRILMAEQLTYDQKTDTMTASGHVSSLDDKNNVAFANTVTLSDKMREGAMEGFAALIGSTGRLAATKAYRSQGRFTTAYRAAYTPCKICNKPGQRTPLWQIKSYRVVYDQLKHRIKFHDATVDFLGVPILYTPYMTQPDPTVRYASGLLAPDLGSSSIIG